MTKSVSLERFCRNSGRYSYAFLASVRRCLMVSSIDSRPTYAAYEALYVLYGHWRDERGAVGLHYTHVCTHARAYKHTQSSFWECALLLTYFTYFRLTLLPSAHNRTSVLHQVVDIGHRIPISLYHFGTLSSHRFRGLPLGRLPTGWITSALLWGAVGVILLTCDHNLILFLFAVCSAGCMFTRRLISSFLILPILVFSAAFLWHLISVVVSICLSFLVKVQFSLLLRIHFQQIT